MSPLFLAFPLTVIQFAAPVAAVVSEEDCKNFLSTRGNWTRTAYLKFKIMMCQLEKRDIRLRAEDAEYYLYQQEMSRECLVKELQTRARSSAIYFQKVYTDADALRNCDPFCVSQDAAKLRHLCAEVLRNRKVDDVFDVFFDYGTREQPHCRLMAFNLQKLKKNHTLFLRNFLKCPVWVRKQGDKDFVFGAYITSADDPKYYGSLIYILVPQQTGNILNVICLQIHHHLRMSDGTSLRRLPTI